MSRSVSRRATAVLSIALACALAACSEPAVTPATDAAPATAASQPLPDGWLRVIGTDIPRVARSRQDLPVTVRSDDGVEVTITDTARTIVGNDDIVMVMDALELSDQVFAAPTNSVTETGLKAPHHFL